MGAYPGSKIRYRSYMGTGSGHYGNYYSKHHYSIIKYNVIYMTCHVICVLITRKLVREFLKVGSDRVATVMVPTDSS